MIVYGAPYIISNIIVNDTALYSVESVITAKKISEKIMNDNILSDILENADQIYFLSGLD